MRNIILMRGPPGSGKSTLIEKLGLAPYSLSMDGLRKIVTGPMINASGMLTISTEVDDRCSVLFSELLAERMNRGETLVIDTTGIHLNKEDSIYKLAQEHGYAIACVDMTGVPVDTVIQRNRARDDYQRVPEKSMRRMLERFALPWSPPPGVTHLRYRDDGLHEQALMNWLQVPSHDLSAYSKVVFIGDLQGCLTPLTGKGGLLEHGFEENVAYIFVGDLLDRGPENGKLLRWFVDQALARDNVFLIHGNHEDHLWRWGRGLPAVSAEFEESTLPQLLEEGCTPKEALLVCKKALPLMQVTWQAHKVLVTHAGMPTLPNPMWGVSCAQLARGTGRWSDPVDEQFERNAPRDWEQVHGHRNNGGLAIQATARSFNLEDQVEKGGNLRAVRLDESGWHPISVRNNTFVPWRESRHKRKEWAPDWMLEPRACTLPPELITQMREHPGVNESIAPSRPHVHAFTFSPEVFSSRNWDDVVVKARGLFFNTHTGEVVARGYEKFFNVGERADTTVDALAKSMKWPVRCFVKENGFLGNLGYDSETDSLMFASKSTPDSEFASWFKDIFDQAVAPSKQEELRRFLRTFECSMVFEVIDPVRDPHLIEYNGPSVVLLDAFHRGPNPRKMAYEDLKKVGAQFGLPVKDLALVLQSPEAFRGWMDRTNGDLNLRLSGRDIEGMVLEDAAGFQTKVKFARYNFWKRMRSARDRLKRGRKALAQAALNPRHVQARENAEAAIASALTLDSHPLGKAFLGWLGEQPDATLQKDVLTLRGLFHAAVPQDPAWTAQRWFFEETPARKSAATP